jgi:4'-phosphopantetheinyl transferase EntD
MIEQILPRSVRVGEAFSDRPGVVLYPEESAVIVRAVEKRRREFATVRGCARDALSALGIEPAPIVPGLRGAPAWPAEVVGSMTHCAGYRAAVVARKVDLRSVGIDAEINQPLPPGMLERISLPEEREQLAELADGDLSTERLLFCVKETVYKTWFPLTHRFLDFHEASVALRRDGTFTAVLRLDGPAEATSWPNDFSGRWLAANGLVLSASSVAADP